MKELVILCGLMPRDIRKLATSSLSHIRIRPSTVLLHLFHLKALVQRDRIILLDDETSVPSRVAFMHELHQGWRQMDTALTAEASSGAEAAVRRESYGRQQFTFEFHALEAVFISVVLQLEEELEALRLSTELVLRSLEDDIDHRTLITLLNLSNNVAQFTRHAELVRTAVEDILDRDDRVAALYLTTKAAKDVGDKTMDDDLTVPERLLGSYYIAYSEIVQEAHNLASGIRNTQERSEFYNPAPVFLIPS
jgi:magnesium transporter